ncbi:hypothetical protein FA13DRAFT_1795808 [Coprinellus micaceus]|uniref:Uncharacterized protein n=1 Tax=Coprinellus micaceus TaxID=71717 RepID=A0A4Y7SWA6_COPMI|nr:hypothetical protein FA13DRAFT_1795808 [Coprinellus micaceus]
MAESAVKQPKSSDSPTMAKHGRRSFALDPMMNVLRGSLASISGEATRPPSPFREPHHLHPRGDLRAHVHGFQLAAALAVVQNNQQPQAAAPAVVQNDQQTQAAAPVVVQSKQQAQAAAPAVAQNDQQPQTADSNADPARDPEEGTGVPTTSTKAGSSNGAQPTSTDAQPTDSNETTSKASIALADNPTISADSAETVNATEGTPKAKPTVPCTPAPATTALVLDIPKAPKIKRKRSLESIDEENPDPKRRTRTTRNLAAQDELPQPPKKRARKAAEKVGTTAKATRATSKSVSVAPATPLQAAERARPTASARARKVADYATRAPSKAKTHLEEGWQQPRQG